MSGGRGDDTMTGDLGNDEFAFSDSDFGGGVWTDVVDGGAGNADTIDLSNVTQGWSLDVDSDLTIEATEASNPSQYADAGGISGTITFDDGSTITFDNIEKVDW